jgi:hypothetical protein
METTMNIMAVGLVVAIALTIVGAFWMIGNALCIWGEWRRIRRVVARKHARQMKAVRDRARSAYEMVDHLSMGRTLDYERGGRGVADVIRTILSDVVGDNLGESVSPYAGVKSADVLETDMLVSRFADYVMREIDTFKEGIKLRNARISKWGKASVKIGVAEMMSLSYTRGSWLLRDFAKIWAKEHKDDRQKDLLSPEQIKRWREFSTREQMRINLMCERSKIDFFD